MSVLSTATVVRVEDLLSMFCFSPLGLASGSDTEEEPTQDTHWQSHIHSALMWDVTDLLLAVDMPWNRKPPQTLALPKEILRSWVSCSLSAAFK